MVYTNQDGRLYNPFGPSERVFIASSTWATEVARTTYSRGAQRYAMT